MRFQKINKYKKPPSAFQSHNIEVCANPFLYLEFIVNRFEELPEARSFERFIANNNNNSDDNHNNPIFIYFFVKARVRYIDKCT